MRFLLAGALATLTAAGLAAIRPAVVTSEERTAALAIGEVRMRADARFLSSDLLEERGPGPRRNRIARAYLASRFEAIGLEPGAPGGSWEQPLDLAGAGRSSANVIGRLRGRDPELSREAVVYNGALDSASGLAALLAIAEACAALPERPRRSILFAAAPAGEGGLVGSDRVAATLDVDGTTVEGARLLFHVGVKVADAPDLGR
jgi:hypothetical protein